MPRSPRPWLRKQTGYWYICLDGKQVRLSEDRDEAHRIWHRLLAERGAVPTPDAPDATVASILDVFLVWCRDNRKQRTLEVYKDFCQDFVDHVGKDLLVAELKPFHITRWLQTHPAWGASTQNLAIRCVQRPLTRPFAIGPTETSAIMPCLIVPSRSRSAVDLLPRIE